VNFKGILEELDARLHLADVFRRRLSGLPGGLHRPYRVDDPSFDLEYHAGLVPLAGGLNLIHVVASYNGTLSISGTADRDALPDPATYAECMEKAFQELLEATDGVA